MSKLRQNDYSDRLKQIRDKYQNRHENRDQKRQDIRCESIQSDKYEDKYQPRPNSKYSVKHSTWEAKSTLQESPIFTLRDIPGQSTPHRLICNPEQKPISHRHIPQKELLRSQMELTMQKKTKKYKFTNNPHVELQSREKDLHKEYDPIQSYRIRLRSALKQIQGCSDSSEKQVPDLKDLKPKASLFHHLPFDSKQSNPIRQESYRPLKGSSSYNIETSPVRKWEVARVDENGYAEVCRRKTDIFEEGQKYAQPRARVETLKEVKTVNQCPYNVSNIDRIQQKIQNAVGGRSRR